MKYYAAVSQEQEVKAATIIPPYCILASYHYFKNRVKLIQEGVHNQYDIFIDSGAFSAANSNKEVNIDEYCKFLIETEVTLYAGLDVIGNAKATRENNDYMKKEYGLNPIPTFHMGSNINDLEELMDYHYIALGGMVFGGGVEGHCDAVWAYILKHNPKLKVHGFGITNINLMSRYPWYSVDSSSWTSGKRYGRQSMLWNGFDWKTFEEEEFINFLRKLGFPIADIEHRQRDWTPEKAKENAKINRDRLLLYDFFTVQSYRLFGAHLKELNKIKDFSYLTCQQTLF